MLFSKIQRDMASVLDSTTANKAVTLSDDTAVCGSQNVRPAVDFERCCINSRSNFPESGFEFYPDKPIAVFTEASFCLFVFFFFPFIFTKRQVNHNCLVNFTG